MNKQQQQAKQLIQQGEFKQALAIYQNMLAHEDADAEQIKLAAIASTRLGEHQQAIDWLTRGIQQYPDDVHLHCTLGMIYKRLSRTPQAITALKAALKIQADHPSALLHLGIIAYTKNDFKKAHRYYQQALDSQPDWAEVHYHLGLLSIQQQHIDDAMVSLLRACQCDPQHASALGQLGELHLQQKNYAQACQYLTHRLELQPHHAPTWHSLGQAETYLGQFKQAKKSFENCLADDRQHPQANHDLANVLVKMGDLNSALTFYFRQIECQIQPDTYYNIGVLLMYQERNKEAIQYLSQALKLDPSNHTGHINLASIYLKNNQLELAKFHYKKALAIKPNDSEITHILAAITQDRLPEKAPEQYLKNLFDQYASHYDKHLTEHLHYDTPKQLFEIIAHEHKPNGRWTVIDLGCGTGLCGELFRPFAKQLIGIDISEKMIAQAQNKKVFDTLHTGDIFSYLPSYSDVDLLLAADVFTYTGNLTPLLQCCFNALSGGGELIFTVEKSTQPNYTLQPSIRYAHHRDYVQNSLAQANLTCISFEPIILRQQQKKPVHGFAVYCQRPFV